MENYTQTISTASSFASSNRVFDITKYLGFIDGYVRKYCRAHARWIDSEEIRDTVQDCSLHLLEKMERYNVSYGSPKPLMVTIMTNYLRTSLKRLNRNNYEGRTDFQPAEDTNMSWEECVGVASPGSCDDYTLTEEYKGLIERAEECLSPKERLVHSLKFQGLSKEEIMQQTGMTGNAVDKNWSCAQNKVKNYLEMVYDNGIDK